MIRNKKKVLIGVAAALAVMSATAGCTSQGAQAGSGGSSTGSNSHLARVLKSKTIKIAVQSQAAPWGVQQSDGHYEGFDIDIANALGKALGAKVEFTAATNESRIPLLQADKVDVVIASFTATDERAQQVGFTIPYAAGGTLIAVPANSSIHSYDDLKGKTVSASRGSIGETILKAHFPAAKPSLFNSFADSVQALKSGKVDALIENNVIVPQLAAQDPSIRILQGPVLEPSLMSMGIQQGDQVWMDYLNTFIRNYNVSGENDASSQKWLHQPMPDFLK
ncbi:MAG TPA: transporter substrate-binding domain-containing protein [Blastococcus sp.]|jgi:polar amino acid transport system substrate-binding protein|nr:transporter substrate-binding domain-containing protein [Blastococcus sp.]